MLDPLNRSLSVLAAHYAEVNAIPLIASTMGAAPPLLTSIPDPRDASAPMHPFYIQNISYPPSHSPFVASFEAQRAQAAFQLQASQQQAESFFPATFEGQQQQKQQQQPIQQATSFFPTTFEAAQETTKREEAEVIARQQEQKELQERVQQLVDNTNTSAAATAVPDPVNVQPKSRNEHKLRAVGSRRGSIRDISAIRDKEIAENAEKNASLAKLLANNSKEELIEEVIFLRKKVSALETQLAEKILTKN
jgi:type II secretory pathway component HofQ